jgi:hypothetical protein
LRQRNVKLNNGPNAYKTLLDFFLTQHYSCVMISVFDAHGNLPPGIHLATWDELFARFGNTPHRQRLLAGLGAALLSLKDSGCRRAYIDGSFVTAKETAR